jgi:hypothetical protein
MGRTQCEGAEIYRNASKTLNWIGTGFGAIAQFAPPPARPYIESAGAIIGIGFAGDADQKADRLERNCRVERVRDAIQGIGQPAVITAYPGSGGKCGELFLPSRVPTHNDGDTIVVSGGRYIYACQPIALDLDGNGLAYRSILNPVVSDEEGTGRFSGRAWIGASDGLLVCDANGNGVGEHDEWVLTSFVEHSETDLDALKIFDTYKDGVLNANDERFSQFKIGRDLNQNGAFEAGELFSLQNYGITAFKLFEGIQRITDPSDPDETAPGIVEFDRGQFVRTDGSTGVFSNVAFTEHRIDELVYADSTASVLSYGGAAALLWNSSSALSVNLAGASYAGYSNFIDVVGGIGNDWIIGNGTNNFLIGGDGADVLRGEAGDDTILADYDDLYGDLQGGAGEDSLVFNTPQAIYMDVAARSFELVIGGSGADYLYSSFATWNPDDPKQGGVTLIGGDGNDTLAGGAGSDVLVGGNGADSISGGDGHDVVVIDESDYLGSISGGAGWYDTLSITGANGTYIANLFDMGFENAYGGDGSDTIYASRSDSNYWQQKYNNFLSGGKGYDFIYGGAGADTYQWQRGDGNKTFRDRDYGEIKGDVIALMGVTADHVTISWGSNPAIVISGQGGGTIYVQGFGLSGPKDMLFVDGKLYDLTGIVTPVQGFGTIYVNQMTPMYIEGQAVPTGGSGGGGSGGGGTGGGGSGGGGGGGVDPGGGPNPIPPVVLDLDGDGFELIAYKGSKARFDWDGDGRRDKTGWVGPDDAFLVLDCNGDGMITEANEVSFGTRGEEGTFVSDLEGLRIFDTNKNDSLDVGDADFSRFGVWQDLDSDGISDPGELKGVLEVGLEALALTAFRTGDPIVAKQNTIYATSDAVFSDGSSIKIADALLAFKDRYHSGHKGSEGAFVEAEVPMTPAVYMNGVRDIFSEHFAIA